GTLTMLSALRPSPALDSRWTISTLQIGTELALTTVVCGMGPAVIKVPTTPSGEPAPQPARAAVQSHGRNEDTTFGITVLLYRAGPYARVVPAPGARLSGKARRKRLRIGTKLPIRRGRFEAFCR